MAIIGFHYKKMLAQKTKQGTGKVNVKSNISFTQVQEAKVNMGAQKQKGVEFTFQFTTNYEPKIGSVELEGAVVYLGKEDAVDKALKMWDDDKKIPEDIMEEVYNYLLAKCNVQALILGKDMGLPPHLPMPKVERKPST